MVTDYSLLIIRYSESLARGRDTCEGLGRLVVIGYNNGVSSGRSKHLTNCLNSMITHPLRDYLLGKPHTTEEHPFGPENWVYKVGGKIFAIASFLDDPVTINLKCDPDDAIVLRQMYTAVQPGYHMNKKHWNTVTFNGSIPEAEFYAMIDHSYRLIVQSLPKNKR